MFQQIRFSATKQFLFIVLFGAFFVFFGVSQAQAGCGRTVGACDGGFPANLKQNGKCFSWTCSGDPCGMCPNVTPLNPPSTPVCGDGIINQPDEQCEIDSLGNIIFNDGTKYPPAYEGFKTCDQYLKGSVGKPACENCLVNFDDCIKPCGDPLTTPIIKKSFSPLYCGTADNTIRKTIPTLAPEICKYSGLKDSRGGATLIMPTIVGGTNGILNGITNYKHWVWQCGPFTVNSGHSCFSYAYPACKDFATDVKCDINAKNNSKTKLTSEADFNSKTSAGDNAAYCASGTYVADTKPTSVCAGTPNWDAENSRAWKCKVETKDPVTKKVLDTKTVDCSAGWPVKEVGEYYVSVGENQDSYINLSSTDLTFFTGDFTIEAWVYTSVNKYTLFDNRSNYGYLGFSVVGDQNDLTIKVGNGDTMTFFGSGVKINTWTHIAIVRKNNVFRSFKNGMKNATFWTKTYNFTEKNTYIGRGLECRLDKSKCTDDRFNFYEFRISNVARWGENSFALPSPNPQYKADSNTVLLIHSDGPNNSTDIKDRSFVPKTINVLGNVRQYKK